jgi:hypothetical protein
MPRNDSTPTHEPRRCQHCQREFCFRLALSMNGRERSNPGRYCSRQCKVADQTRKVIKPCARCGKPFALSPSVARRRYCSRECAGNAPAKETRACVVCGEPFTCTKNEKALCCSRPCSVKYRTGRTKRAMLDDGTARFHYTTREWRMARRAAIERDGGACVRCGSDYRLSAHHIRRWEDSRDDSPDNLITLCAHCHGVVEAAVRNTQGGGQRADAHRLAGAGLSE